VPDFSDQPRGLTDQPRSSHRGNVFAWLVWGFGPATRGPTNLRLVPTDLPLLRFRPLIIGRDQPDRPNCVFESSNGETPHKRCNRPRSGGVSKNVGRLVEVGRAFGAGVRRAAREFFGPRTRYWAYPKACQTLAALRQGVLAGLGGHVRKNEGV
jgi:hypothetical protein